MNIGPLAGLCDKGRALNMCRRAVVSLQLLLNTLFSLQCQPASGEVMEVSQTDP